LSPSPILILSSVSTGEFVGGCDIVRDMHVAKELTPLLAKAGLVKTAESK
jgi:hypothetical protein